MARGEKGSLLSGFHGRLNDMMVIKQRNGKPVLCIYPKGRRIKWTENQKKHRMDFKFATIYAAYAVNDPVSLAFYRQYEHDGINAYNLAIADYLHKPEITSIDIRKARGKDQYLIRVRATDDYIVTQVQLNLIELAGTCKREQAKQFRHSGLWICRISSEKLSTVGTIEALAYDYTGNHTLKKHLISPQEASKRLPRS